MARIAAALKTIGAERPGQAHDAQVRLPGIWANVGSRRPAPYPIELDRDCWPRSDEDHEMLAFKLRQSASTLIRVEPRRRDAASAVGDFPELGAIQIPSDLPGPAVQRLR